MGHRVVVAAMISVFAAIAPCSAEPLVSSVKGSSFVTTDDTSPDVCGCSPGSHVDPICAFAFGARDCAEAFVLGASGQCLCLPDRSFQLAQFATDIPTSVGSDGRESLATLLAHLLRQSVQSALVIDSTETHARLLFQVFPATDGQNQASVRLAIQKALVKFGSSNITARVLIHSRDFGLAGIDAELGVSPNGKDVFAHGPIECPLGQRVSPLEITVTQDSVGAIAHGSWTKNCIGSTQQWNLKAHKSEHSNPFVPGSAEVCAWAAFRVNNAVQTAKQWCADVTLTEVPK